MGARGAKPRGLRGGLGGRSPPSIGGPGGGSPLVGVRGRSPRENFLRLHVKNVQKRTKNTSLLPFPPPFPSSFPSSLSPLLFRLVLQASLLSQLIASNLSAKHIGVGKGAAKRIGVRGACGSDAQQLWPPPASTCGNVC